MSTADSHPDDPFEAHFRRDPRAGAGILVLVLDAGRPERAGHVGAELAKMIRSRGRKAECQVLASRAEAGLGRTLEEGLLGADDALTLVLVTTAVEPWTAGHLDPLLKAIDACDHVVGRRPATALGRVARRLAWLRWKLLFAVPVLDVHSPCRLHRREALGAIPLQSESDFLDIEILAKGTFLGHLIDEVPVPPLESDPEHQRDLRRFDFDEVFRHPVFSRSSPFRPRGGSSGPAGSPVPPPDRGPSEPASAEPSADGTSDGARPPDGPGDPEGGADRISGADESAPAEQPAQGTHPGV